MSRVRNTTNSLWGQGGVALADILANSVAVILIMIVVTLSAQQDKAQKELEKNADVTTLLARQLATTVVYNDLPSSPPAILHDYNNCRIPHDCNPKLFPIIELHQNTVREYNSAISLTRNELLPENNPLDQLIETFTAEERLNLRVDVYDVNLYYLAMGILNEHNIRVRHWHYLGEDVVPPKSIKDILKEGGSGEADKDLKAMGKPTKGDQFKDGRQGDQEGDQQNGTSLLENTQLADIETLQQLQVDSLLPPAQKSGQSQHSQSKNQQGGGSTNTPSDNEGEQSGKNGKSKQSSPDTIFESLVDLFGQRGLLDKQNNQSNNSGSKNPKNQKNNAKSSNGQGSQGSSRRSMRLHVPNAKQLSQSKNNSNSIGAPMSIQVPKESYNQLILTFLLDKLQLARLQQTAFTEGSKQILERYAKNLDHLQQHPYASLVNQLEQQLSRYEHQPATAHAPLIFQPYDQKTQLHLIPNQVATTSTLFINARQTDWYQTLTHQSQRQLSMVLRSFPGLFGGQRLDFPPGFLILLHPDEQQHPEMQWRPMVIVDSWLENPSIGFIRSALKEGQLIIDPHTAQTQINKILIPETPLKTNDFQLTNTRLLYLLAAIIIFILLSLSAFKNMRHTRRNQKH